MTVSIPNPDDRGLLDALPVGVLVSSLPDGKVVFANRHACETLGLDPADTNDLHTTDLYERLEDRENMVQRLMRHERLDDAEFEMRRPDGDLKWVRISAGIVERDGGRVAVSAIRDVTGARAAERQRRTAHRMEAFRRIAGGLAHEVNNALVPIMTFGELARDEAGADSTVHSHLGRVLDAANRCADVVSRVMEFSATPSGEPTTVDARRIVASAGELLEVVAPRRIGVDVDLPGEPVWVVADPASLEEAAFAVGLDAADAYGEASGVVSLALTELDLDATNARSMGLAPGRHARLRVCDAGQGGGEDAALERVFDPHLSGREARQERGLGLGLARRAVVTHDGAVRVDEDPGGGTSVSIWLPLASAGPADPGIRDGGA